MTGLLDFPDLEEPSQERSNFEFGLLGDYGDAQDKALKIKMLLARLGYNVPMDNSNLNFGITGQNLDINSPFFNMDEKRISGLDATYSRPNDFFRLGVSRQPKKNSPELQNLIQLQYGRNF